jgi:hypothetical protein
MTQRVICAAMQNKHTRVVLCSVRHYDGIIHMALNNYLTDHNPEDWIQGFVDNKGNFLTREEAHKVASAANQIIRRCGGDEVRLFSENLY